MLRFTRQHMDLAYDSKVVAFYRDYLKTPAGDIVVYDYIKHKTGGGAGVLLVDSDENTYLVKLYRNSIDDISIEIPAGGYSREGETGEECARREAGEETGLIPRRMYHVANTVSSIGTFDEKTDIYIGTDLKKVARKLDADEFIDIVTISVSDALRLVYDGVIIDAKTVTALFAYEHFRRSGIIENI